MSKVIAVWGAPNSGKTTFATKLARSIYDEYQATVIVVYADNETPTLPIIFPNYKKEDLCSVGVALSKTDIDRHEVVKQMVTVKDKQNFCFLGFTDGENKYTYPTFDATKVRSLYSVLASLADYVIVDCTSSLKNPLSKVAVREADEVIRLSAPNLKSVSYLASQLPLYIDPMFRLEEHIQGICVTDADLYMPIMTSIPDNKRVFTIESGSRELSLVRRGEDGHIVNNAVHTLSRPSDNPAYDITQEDLVVASLRFNPDIVCVGEMRDVECYSAVEASLTGHTVVSTVHAGPGSAAHMRIALLCQKRFPINFQTSLMQAGQAFPIVVYSHKLENNSRKCMDISECIINAAGEREYNCLYNYEITKNTIEDEQFIIEGHFCKPNMMSDSLRRRLVQYGVPQNKLNRFLKGDDSE